MNAINFQLAGYYKLEAVKNDGTRRVLADWFPNLITNAGLDLYGNHSGVVFGGCAVGSGNTTPAFTDTNLVGQLAFSSTLQTSTQGSDTGAGYHWKRFTYRFAAGSATGNLAEVGMRVTSSGTLFSRALILDGGGSPTTVTILADESLDVSYELRVYWPTADVTGSITISGQSYNYTIRPAYVGNNQWALTPAGADFSNPSVIGTSPLFYTGTIAANTSGPSGTSGSTTYSRANYVSGNYYRDFTVTLALSALTVSAQSLGIGTTIGGFQIGFSPAIPKTGSNILTMTLRLSWARRTI